MFAGVNIAGAGQRLLHERIPMRFFGIAVTAHILAWAALAGVAQNAPGFAGGIGPEIAAVHVLTLGVLVATAMGASLQMLPVALSRPAPPEAACEAVFWSFAAGAVLLIGGFAVTAPTFVAAGAVVAAIGIGIYAVLIGRTLIGHRGQRLVALHVWAAQAAVAVAAAVLAVLLAADIDHGFLPDHGRTALAHAVLAGYGFMGLLALGFSHIMIPMFAIAQPPQGRAPEVAFWLVVTALVAGVIGALLGSTPVVVVAVGLAITGAGLHVRHMVTMLRSRMRKRLGPEFLLIGASWVLLLASLIAAGTVAIDFAPDTGPALFGFLLLFGWLLTLLVGVLQRIMPFLASMHTARAGKAPATPSALTNEKPLTIHRICHLSAVAAVGIGIGIDAPSIITAGAIAGTIGAIFFAWFALTVATRAKAHVKGHAMQQGSQTS